MKNSSSLLLVVTAVLLVAVAPASAATTIGSPPCVANYPAIGAGITVQTSLAGGPSPVSSVSGVITRWSSGVDPTADPSDLTELVVVRRSGTVYRVLGRSAPTSHISLGVGSPTRIPISQGDELGIHGQTSSCNGVGGTNFVGWSDDDAGVGETFMIGVEASNYIVPINAVVEPDADGDGYGDETQDFCTQSAARQAYCPASLSVSALPQTGKSALTFQATANDVANLSLVATVKIPKIGKKRATTLPLNAVSGNATPGALTRLNLKYSSALKKAIKSAKKSQKLKLTWTLTGNGDAGATTTTGSITLRGTKRR